MKTNAHMHILYFLITIKVATMALKTLFTFSKKLDFKRLKF